MAAPEPPGAVRRKCGPVRTAGSETVLLCRASFFVRSWGFLRLEVPGPLLSRLQEQGNVPKGQAELGTAFWGPFSSGVSGLGSQWGWPCRVDLLWRRKSDKALSGDGFVLF